MEAKIEEKNPLFQGIKRGRFVLHSIDLVDSPPPPSLSLLFAFSIKFSWKKKTKEDGKKIAEKWRNFDDPESKFEFLELGISRNLKKAQFF